MTYEEYAPAPQLRPWIAAYWSFRVGADAGEFEHTIPLTGGAMLITSPHAPAMFVGPRTTPLTTKVRGGDEFGGVHFWPGAAGSLLGAGVRDMREKIVPAEKSLAAGWVRTLSDRVWGGKSIAEAMDTSFVDLAAAAGRLDDLVMTSVFRLIRDEGRPTLGELSEGVGLSEKQLRRRFAAAVEMTPKELARLRRMRASAVESVVGSARGWVEIAAEHGYADQAHLVREFRRLVGLTPKAFDAYIGRIRHGRILS